MGFAHASVFGKRWWARLDSTFLAVDQRILNQRSMRNTDWKAESVFFYMIPYVLELAMRKGVFGDLGIKSYTSIRIVRILYKYTVYCVYEQIQIRMYSANLTHFL
jgi:hypothetical protein